MEDTILRLPKWVPPTGRDKSHCQGGVAFVPLSRIVWWEAFIRGPKDTGDDRTLVHLLGGESLHVAMDPKDFHRMIDAHFGGAP